MTKPNRFDMALLIQDGATNTSGIALAIIEACKEVRNEGVLAVHKDTAIRLMVHQLSLLCKANELSNPTEYISAMQECKKKRKAV